MALADLTDGLIALSLSGPGARTLLAKGCALDLHPRSFAPGRCARTILARTVAVIHRGGADCRFDLYIDRSYAEYVWRWLGAAAGSFVGPAP